MPHLQKKGTNQTDVQEMNRSLAIRLIRQMSICTRAELAKATGLTQPTITNIVNDLISWGLVKETGLINGGLGRRSIGIALVHNRFKVLGVRLTRNYISVGLFELDGMERSFLSRAIDAKDGVTSALNTMKRMITEILCGVELDSVVAMGVAVPGPLLHDGGKIGLMSGFPGWEMISIQDELRKTFDIKVYVEHDAKVGALAEWWFGSHGKGIGSLLYVTVAQGVGAGLVVDGEIYKGAMGFAGEIGHMSIQYDGPRCECGNNGCLELYCSVTALLKRLHPRYTRQTLWNALEKGDDAVRQEFERAAWFLGFGLVNAVNLLNPQCIVLGDELIKAGRPILGKVNEVLRAHLLPDAFKRLIVKFSSFPNTDPILVGASALAIDQILHNPSAYINVNRAGG